MKVNLTVQYEKETVERDEYGFTKEGREDLQKALDEKNLKSYSNVHSLINDLIKNVFTY